jgi:hypothetical protein
MKPQYVKNNSNEVEVFPNNDFGVCCAEIKRWSGIKCCKKATHFKRWLLDLESGDHWFLIPSCDDHK